jgi:hypothetical protein
MSRKTAREIPRAANGLTRRATSSRWPVDNSVDEYLRFLNIWGLFRQKRLTQFYPKRWNIDGTPTDDTDTTASPTGSGIELWQVGAWVKSS